MNKKSTQQRAQILHLLVEGNSIRSTSRIAGVSINTVVKLLIEAGEACSAYQDKALRGLTCKRVQVDEIWSFCGMKEKNDPAERKCEFGIGDVWTFTAICADTKLVLSWLVGERNAVYAKGFTDDLRARLANRVQLTSDGHRMNLEAVEVAFGCEVDFAQLGKHYGGPEGKGPESRYSPGECCGTTKQPIEGNPHLTHVSISYIERLNLTMRMMMRRFTRLTNAFSKKVENHEHAIALHFMHYNFVRIHKSLRMTPAMAAGVNDKLWSLEDVFEMIDAYWAEKKSN